MQPTELCRICGGTGLFLPIFDPECKYFDDIESCLSVRVKRNDSLSQVVCHKCVGTLSLCKGFVGKVNHVKKSRFEPSSKLCFGCRTADGPLFPLPTPSAEKLQEFFSLNTQKAKNLKICHECQFALDSISDLREKANTAQQLSRRGQHLQFQVLRKSPSVEDLLSSLKNREVEVDLGSRSSRSSRGPRLPSSPVGGEATPRTKQQNGISNSKNLEDNKTRKKTGTKNSRDSDSGMSVILFKLDDQESGGKSDEKNNKLNSRSSESKTTKKREVRNSRGRGQQDSENDKEMVENSSGREINPASPTSSVRAEKRKRNEDKTVDSVSSSPLSAASVRSRRQSKEEKALNESHTSQGTRSSDSSSKETETPSTKKLKESKGTQRKSSLDLSSKNKRLRFSEPAVSEEISDGNLSDDSDVVLSSLADSSRPLRSKTVSPKSTSPKNDKSSKKKTEENIPANKRPVAKAVDAANSRSKRSSGKKDVTGSQSVKTVAKASKRKLADSDIPERNAGKTRKQEDKPNSDSETESPSGKRVVKKAKVVPVNPYTCGVCSKDFESTALGKDHELQHDNRYNNFAVKLCRVDLTKNTLDQESKDVDDDLDLWSSSKSSKPEQSTNSVDFDSILKGETINLCETSPDINSGPEEDKISDKTAENAESEEPKDPGPEELKLASSVVEPESMVEDKDKETDKDEEKDTSQEKKEDEKRCEEPTVSTESEDSKLKESETQEIESKEASEQPEDTGEQNSEPEKVESSELKELEEMSPESEESKSEGSKSEGSKSEGSKSEGSKSEVPPRDKKSPTSELIAVLEDSSAEAPTPKAEDDKEPEDSGPTSPEPTLSTNIGVVEEEEKLEEKSAPCSPVLGRKESAGQADESEDPASKPDLVAEDKDVPKTGKDDTNESSSAENVRNGEESSPPVGNGDETSSKS